MTSLVTQASQEGRTLQALLPPPWPLTAPGLPGGVPIQPCSAPETGCVRAAWPSRPGLATNKPLGRSRPLPGIVLEITTEEEEASVSVKRF